MVTTFNDVDVALLDLLRIQRTFADYYLDARRGFLHLLNYSDNTLLVLLIIVWLLV